VRKRLLLSASDPGSRPRQLDVPDDRIADGRCRATADGGADASVDLKQVGAYALVVEPGTCLKTRVSLAGKIEDLEVVPASTESFYSGGRYTYRIEASAVPGASRVLAASCDRWRSCSGTGTQNYDGRPCTEWSHASLSFPLLAWRAAA
jgi:hypothetical protein